MLKITLGKIVVDERGNNYRVIEQVRHWETPYKKTYRLHCEKGNFFATCESDGSSFICTKNGSGYELVEVKGGEIG